ncbi:MAG: hypothetical protein AAFV19_09030 [Pseudomonadota bacterium]
MAEVFTALKTILTPYADRLKVIADTDTDYVLDSHHVMPNGKELFFGAVKFKKSYTSFHLMPVYVYPSLLEPISEGLRKRMQGKSCFNFRKPDEALFAELSDLTSRGFDAYRENGQI